MKPPPPPQFRDRGSSGRHQRSGSLLIAGNLDQVRRPPQALAARFITLTPEKGIVFARRAICRRCARPLWAWYFLNLMSELISQQAQPLQPCRNMPLCKLELQGLEPGCMAGLIFGGWNA